MKLNNKGFTLIEVMVVIAIIAILATGFTVSAKYVSSAEAKEAAYQVDSLLSRIRTSKLNGMGNAPQLIFRKNTATNEYLVELRDSVVGENSFMGSILIETYVFDAEDLYIEVVNSRNGVVSAPREATFDKIEFTRETGELKDTSTFGGYEEIIFTKNGISYIIDIVPETGFHEVRK